MRAEGTAIHYLDQWVISLLENRPSRDTDQFPRLRIRNLLHFSRGLRMVHRLPQTARFRRRNISQANKSPLFTLLELDARQTIASLSRDPTASPLCQSAGEDRPDDFGCFSYCRAGVCGFRDDYFVCAVHQ